jgi:hypothetical protein
MDRNNVRITNKWKKDCEEIYNMKLDLDKWEKYINEMYKFELWCNKIYNS